jgi:hypothetical protein
MVEAERDRAEESLVWALPAGTRPLFIQWRRFHRLGTDGLVDDGEDYEVGLGTASRAEPEIGQPWGLGGGGGCIIGCTRRRSPPFSPGLPECTCSATLLLFSQTAHLLFFPLLHFCFFKDFRGRLSI